MGRLKRGDPHVAVVHDRAQEPRQHLDAAVDDATPSGLAETVESMAVARDQERLGLAVATLLPKVAADSAPPVVIHLGRSGEQREEHDHLYSQALT